MVRRTVLLLLLVGCASPNPLRVDFGDPPVGFTCEDDSGKLLAARAATPGHLRMSLLVDFVATGGVPDCRATELLRWCSNHTCEPVRDMRRCFPVDYPVAEPPMNRDQAEQLAAEVLKTVSGRNISEDAPDQPVMVRVIATTLTCADAMGMRDLPLPSLVGCAYSCPEPLDDVHNGLHLDLPSLTSRCERAVDICASSNFQLPPGLTP